MPTDLIFRNAHVIDPSQSINRKLDVHVRDGLIAGLGESLPAIDGATVRDLSGCYLSPGLIDLHGHWYEGSSWGINPDLGLHHGSTTVVDAGTTGFLNFGEFRATRIAHARAQVLAFINIAAWGIPTSWFGELEDLRAARPNDTIAALEAHPGVALGVKVRMKEGHSHQAFGMALEAAAATHSLVMVHIGHGAHTRDILRRLRAGDILTHCFQGRGDGIIEAGELIPEALEARKRGIVFDVGHGCGSFNWTVARRAFEFHFYPDTISTDLHRYSIEYYAFDMPVTMTKFLHLGMSLEEVILKSTWIPAKALKREHDLGTLRTGSVADLFAFTLEEGEFPLEDTHRKIEIARRRIKPCFTVKAGEIIEATPAPKLLRPVTDADQEIIRQMKERP